MKTFTGVILTGIASVGLTGCKTTDGKVGSDKEKKVQDAIKFNNQYSDLWDLPMAHKTGGKTKKLGICPC